MTVMVANPKHGHLQSEVVSNKQDLAPSSNHQSFASWLSSSSSFSNSPSLVIIIIIFFFPSHFLICRDHPHLPLLSSSVDQYMMINIIQSQECRPRSISSTPKIVDQRPNHIQLKIVNQDPITPR